MSLEDADSVRIIPVEIFLLKLKIADGDDAQCMNYSKFRVIDEISFVVYTVPFQKNHTKNYNCILINEIYVF